MHPKFITVLRQNQCGWRESIPYDAPISIKKVVSYSVYFRPRFVWDNSFSSFFFFMRSEN